MTQPAVSHALSRLRTLVGDPLLVRAGNEMNLTARAKTLRVPLSEALARVRDVVLPSGFDPALCRRSFRLSMSDYACSVVLTRLLADLRIAAPGIELIISKGGRLETMRQVTDGELDGATGVFSMLPEELKSDVLFAESFVVVTDRRNLVDGTLGQEKYLASPHIHVSTEGLHHSHVDHALSASGLGRHLVAVIPYWLAALDLLAGTDLILTVASRTVRREHLPSELAVIPVPFPVPAFEFVYIFRADTEADPEAMWIRSRIKAIDYAE